MKTKKYLKNQHSEWVIRNSLYWMTPVTRWQLDEDESSWLVHLESADDETLFELNRLLNDYALREKVMLRTQKIREAIATKVLEGIEKRLSL